MSLDYSQERNSFEEIPEGTYEVTCSKCCQDVRKYDGAEIISLQWKIRDDVEQACKGRIIFDDISHNPKDPENKYNDRKIYDIVFKGQDKNDPNSKFKFADYDELCQHLNGINMRVEVGHFVSKNGKTYTQVKIGGYAPTQAKGKVLGGTSSVVANSASAGAQLDASGMDDLPF